jgi:dolichol-phosphate mannosyltransferase
MKNVIVIPTYNEKENITKLLEAISLLKLPNTDTLVVDDNSPDRTSDVVKKLNKSGRLSFNAYVLDRKMKEGLGKAYIAGFKWALEHGYDRIISMDADFSHDPKYLPEMIKKSKKFDVVVGSRYVNGGKITGWKWHRYLNSWGANFVTRLILGLKPKDATAGFKCYSRDFIKSLPLDNIISGGYAFQVEMINYAQEGGFKITETPITFADRREGESKISGELVRSAKAVFALAANKKSYREFARFAVVGVIGTLVDLGFYNLLAIVFKLDIYVSRTISFTFAATNNYILNRIWTFKSKDKKIATEFGKFFFVSIIGLLLNLGLMKLFQGIVVHATNELVKKNIPVLLAIIVVLFWNYFANKYWTFKKNDKNN